MMYSVLYENVCKSYKGKPILSNLSLIIPQNCICLLLGLNGVGKTTLLKLTTGLIAENSGKIEFGFQNINKIIGAIIDTPTFFDGLSGYNNLKYYAISWKCDDNRIGYLMNLVGLNPNDKKPVKKYSLGMKQRLGIARALLNRPQLLILDEPFNGLDPIGIKEIKNLIVKLVNEDKMTVILSSHLIHETDSLADYYVILHKGNVAASFKSKEIGVRLKCIRVKSKSNLLRIEELITTNFKNVIIQRNGDCITVFINSYQNDIDSLIDYISLEANPEEEIKIECSQMTFEEYFIAITGGGHIA